MPMIVDIETFDPLLTSKGPGVYRKDGFILGVGILCPEMNIRKYFPLKHTDTTRAEAMKNGEIIYDLLASDITKVTANGIYDFDWLINGYGFEVNGVWEDVIAREALLYPYHRSYALDNLSKMYGSVGKKEGGAEQVAEAMGFVCTKTKPVQTYFRHFTTAQIEEYALADLDETLFVYEKQQPLLKERGLLAINDMENNLTPLLIKMKKTGVRIDENRRQEAMNKILTDYNQGMRDFEKQYGVHDINFGSAKNMQFLFDKNHIEYGYTAKGNPCFDANMLGALKHPIGKEILRLKSLKTVLNNFVDGSLKEFQINGRIHPCHHATKKDDGGTVTGRFTCSHPNTQQIPSKEEKQGDLIRSCFIPEEGCWWGAPDFSQIEYRVLAHFATGPKSESLREEFRRNPKTDYHQLVMDLTGLSRKYAKNFNFGSIYFMGKKTMSEKFGFSMEECEKLTKQYYGAMPFIAPTRDAMMETARRRGYLKTVLGRQVLLSDDIRANRQEYKLVNYLIQGSAADIMKKGMVEAYNQGLFDVLTPHLTVHDELGVSVPKTREGLEAYKELIYTMEHAVTLDIPIMVDNDIGANWGSLEAVDLDEMILKL